MRRDGFHFVWEVLTERARWTADGQVRRFEANLGRDDYHETVSAWISFYNGQLNGHACVYVCDGGINLGLEGAVIRGDSIPELERLLVEQMKTMRALLFEMFDKVQKMADDAGFRGKNT